MNTQDRLLQYQREMDDLLRQKQEFEDSLERLQIDIDLMQEKIDECEAELAFEDNED